MRHPGERRADGNRYGSRALSRSCARAVPVATFGAELTMTTTALTVLAEDSSINPILNGVSVFIAFLGLLVALLLWGRGRV
jgi:lipopolysaccharide export LptBFGC system permease protein LptF